MGYKGTRVPLFYRGNCQGDDIVIFRPDKFCSQVVVRGNVSGHR